MGYMINAARGTQVNSFSGGARARGEATRDGGGGIFEVVQGSAELRGRHVEVLS